MTSRSCAIRRSAFCRTVLLGICIAALVVSPASAGPRQAPTLDDPPPHKLYLPLLTGGRGPLPTSIDVIDAAVKNGKLDDVTALVYKVYAVFGDPRLPVEYRGPNKAIYTGTEILSEAVGRYPTLPAATQAVLLPFLIPPYYQGSWDDQQPASGAAVAAQPLALPPGKTLAPGGLPEEPLSPKWFVIEGPDVVVWGRVDRPGDRQLADAMYDALEGQVWPTLTDLMKRKPIKDDGQTNHGINEKLDVALTSLVDGGVTLPYNGFRVMGPVQIRINRSLSGDLLRAALAHNFMHALQYTYMVKGNRPYEQWLMESTAVYAEHIVYPKANTEHRFLDAFLDEPGFPLDFISGTHDHGAYLFPFYLGYRYGPYLTRRMWEATETTDSALEAVNSVIEGGFRQQWPEFARYNWNREPQDDYKQVDQVGRGAKALDIDVPNMLAGFPTRDFSMEVPTDVSPLAAYYFHFVFTRDDVSSVVFYNPFKTTHDQDAKVQVLVKIDDAWQPVGDWTTAVRTQSFCRDRRAERVQELVVIITNSNWQNPAHILQAYGAMKLVATNVGCWRWRGTTRSYWEYKNTYTTNSKAELVLQSNRPANVPNSNPDAETFDPVSGTSVSWVTTSPGASCNFSSDSVTMPLKPDDGYLVIHTADMGPYRRLYYGSGAVTFDSTYTMSCPKGDPSHHIWQIASFLATGGSALKWYVGADGRSMNVKTGRFFLSPDSDSCIIASEWNFIAEREP